MPIPSPSTLERLLTPFEASGRVPIRVWALDAGAEGPESLAFDRAIFRERVPRFVALGACEDGLVLVRQTRDSMEDLDGARLPWSSVSHVERDPHLTRDVLVVEVAGKAPLRLAVSNHVLIPGNRHAAKDLCDFAHRHAVA